MDKDCYNQREYKRCHCNCACHCSSINPDFINKSDVLSEMYNQNPNTEFFSSTCNNNSQFYSPQRRFERTYSPKLETRNHFSPMGLQERAQKIKDKINYQSFLETINKNRNSILTFCPLKNLKNLSNIECKKKRLNKNLPFANDLFINDKRENTYLKELLSSVPRHEKNPRSTKSYLNKIKLSFSNGDFRKKRNDIKKFIDTRRFTGYSSMVMPPNDIKTIVIKNNAFY